MLLRLSEGGLPMSASNIVSNLALLDALLAKEKEIETFQA